MIARPPGIILSVFAVIALGYVWGRRNQPAMSTINRLGMNVPRPALILSALALR